MKRFFIMMMLMVTMVFASVANAAPAKVDSVNPNIMAALQQNVQAEGRTKESFMIQGLFDIDTKVLAINMKTGKADLYRLTSITDFEELLRNQLNCKDSRKPESYTVVLANLPMAEQFANAAAQVTQTSSSKNKGPVFKLNVQKNRVPNENLDSFLAEKGFGEKAVFLNMQTGKLVIRPLPQVLDISSKVNDLLSLPTTFKSSSNVLRGKSSWN